MNAWCQSSPAQLCGYPPRISICSSEYTQILTEPPMEAHSLCQYRSARPSLGLAVCSDHTNSIRALVCYCLGLQTQLALFRSTIRQSKTLASQSQQTSPTLEHELVKCNRKHHAEIIQLAAANRTISMCLYQKPEAQQMFYLTWSVQWMCYSVLYGSSLVLFDDKVIASGNERIRRLCYKLLLLANRLDKLDLEQFKIHLCNKTFVGWVADDSQLWFTHVIDCNTKLTLSISQTSKIFHTFSLPYHSWLLEPPYSCSNEWDITFKLLELQHKVSGNRHCMSHNILRIVCQGEILAEFTLRSRERLLFECMQNCIESGQGFHNSQRHYFPAKYYNQIYNALRNFPQCGLNFKERVRVVQYCRQSTFSIESVLKSKYLQQILQISSTNYQNWQFGTYLVYLFLGPVGIGKTDLFNTMSRRAKQFGCEVLFWRKQPDSRLGQFDSSPLRQFFSLSDKHFTESAHSVVLVDYPFYEQLPQQLTEMIQRLVPVGRHFKIFHITPNCMNPLVFQDEILHRNMEFPFSAEIIIHCLRNIQKRKGSDGINGDGVDSLAQALHFVCSAWKNFHFDSHQSQRQRLIKVPYKLCLEGMNKNIIVNLQQLLSMSYKKRYRNEHLLYYFLEQIEQLTQQIEPCFEEICQYVFSQSFYRPKFYPIQ